MTCEQCGIYIYRANVCTHDRSAFGRAPTTPPANARLPRQSRRPRSLGWSPARTRRRRRHEDRCVQWRGCECRCQGVPSLLQQQARLLARQGHRGGGDALPQGGARLGTGGGRDGQPEASSDDAPCAPVWFSGLTPPMHPRCPNVTLSCCGTEASQSRESSGPSWSKWAVNSSGTRIKQ